MTTITLRNEFHEREVEIPLVNGRTSGPATEKARAWLCPHKQRFCMCRHLIKQVAGPPCEIAYDGLGSLYYKEIT